MPRKWRGRHSARNPPRQGQPSVPRRPTSLTRPSESESRRRPRGHESHLILKTSLGSLSSLTSYPPLSHGTAACLVLAAMIGKYPPRTRRAWVIREIQYFVAGMDRVCQTCQMRRSASWQEASKAESGLQKHDSYMQVCQRHLRAANSI